MTQRVRTIRWSLCLMVLACLVSAAVAAPATKPARPTKVYVPYEKLKGVFEADKQGVFLPYDEFQRLWRAAKQSPAAVREAARHEANRPARNELRRPVPNFLLVDAV